MPQNQEQRADNNLLSTSYMKLIPHQNVTARERTKDKNSLKLVHPDSYKTSFIYNIQKLRLQRTKLKYIYTSEVSPSIFLDAPVTIKAAAIHSTTSFLGSVARIPLPGIDERQCW